MSGEVVIREAVEGDIPQLMELWKEFFDFHYERDPLFSRALDGHEKWAVFAAEKIEDEKSRLTVAEAGGRVVAYCLANEAEYPPVMENARYGYIMDLAVTADFRRQGLGGKLLEDMYGWFRGRGLERVEARVAICNEVSMPFWKKMGFKPYVEAVYKRL